MHIFRVEVKEAHIIKTLAETLQGYLKEGCLVCKSTGIYLKGVDSKVHYLVDIEIPAEGFTSYRVPPEGINIGLNLLHFYKLVKSIKKKDELMMYIDEKEPNKLGIKIIQPGESMSTVKHINILKLNPTDVDIPDGYLNPIVSTNKEFQKLKTLNKMSKFIKVTFYDRKIEFFSDRENVYDALVPFGKELEEDEVDLKTDKQNQSFDSDPINRLVKMGCLSNIIQLYPHNSLPLKFKLISSLVKFAIYIKSKDQQSEADNDKEVVMSEMVVENEKE